MKGPVLIKGAPHVPHFSMMPKSEICVGCARFIDPHGAHYVVWDDATEQWWRQCPKCRAAEKLQASA